MNVKRKSTMTWEEAPDVIGIEEYSKITGICEAIVKKEFLKKDFPRLPGKTHRVDKKAAMLYSMGISTKTNSKESLEFLILLELQKLNKKIETKVGESNE